MGGRGWGDNDDSVLKTQKHKSSYAKYTEDSIQEMANEVQSILCTLQQPPRQPTIAISWKWNTCPYQIQWGRS